MNAFLLAVATATGVAGHPGFAPPDSLSVEVVLYQGDPLGNPEDKSLRVIREWKAVTPSGRSVFFKTGGQHAVSKVAWENGTPRAQLSYEAVGAAIDVVPIRLGNGKVYLEVNTWFRAPNADGSLRIDEQQDRRSRIVAPGQSFTVRLAASSPTDQTWVAVRVKPLSP